MRSLLIEYLLHEEIFSRCLEVWVGWGGVGGVGVELFTPSNEPETTF
jgi:hypothetical protein